MRVFLFTKKDKKDMKYVYVLQSESSEIYYVGIAINVAKRLKEHNQGKSKFTKGHRPWVLIYHEESIDWASARKREKYLKSSAGKNWLRKEGIID